MRCCWRRMALPAGEILKGAVLHWCFWISRFGWTGWTRCRGTHQGGSDLRGIWVIAWSRPQPCTWRSRAVLSRGCDDYLSSRSRCVSCWPGSMVSSKGREADEDDFDHGGQCTPVPSDATAAGARERYVVLEAADGESGLRTAMTSIPDLIAGHGDCLILDGQTVVGLLKGSTLLAQTPVVAVTAWPEDYAAEMAKAYGCDGYLSKPISAHLSRGAEWVPICAPVHRGACANTCSFAGPTATAVSWACIGLHRRGTH